LRSRLRAELLVELQIQDSILAGRSPLELTYLLAGGAAGWTVLQVPAPLVVRGLLAAIVIGVAAAFAFLRVAGLDLTAWCFAVFRFLASPDVVVYGPSLPR
jgi:hypothetical protein